MDEPTNIIRNTGLIGAALGAIIAIVWVAFGGLAVLLVLGLALAGWLVGMIFQRPDFVIGLLQRLQQR
ncbi:hypothetical protein [Ilumatobacter coccineus]|uniref:DUF2273 domain-containing protein n=1 Tax=Ilumatobacter coccineus (strain NBRC 103263 / KCTC 29153 / YM16-304) TaxID=1313172 RepID=A0A6C7EEJ0_ILUCY|nr:hypothetical protein [Ilumatobacter coccineus]BAN03589.1 hypothetical protein YM304_32750 [Ilumatobacter coccineus YM16-304]